MPTIITNVRATEEGTIILDYEFKDEDDVLVVPTAMAWTLTDVNGVVINSRSSVAIDPLVDSGSLVLKGDDLAIPSGADESERVVSFVGTYTSGTFGAGIPLTDKVLFTIDNLPGIA